MQKRQGYDHYIIINLNYLYKLEIGENFFNLYLYIQCTCVVDYCMKKNYDVQFRGLFGIQTFSLIHACIR